MSSNLQVLNYRDIEMNNINYDFPKKIKGGSYMSLASYGNDKQKLLIQTPKLETSTGICSNELRSYIELLLDRGHWPFYEFLTNLDEYNVLLVEKKSKDWFNQAYPIDIIDEFYKTNIKLSKRKQPPKIRFKIHMSKKEILCDIYNQRQELIHPEKIANNSKVIAVLELIGLKFLKQQFSIEWRVVQMKIFEDIPSSKKIQKYIVNDQYLTDNEETLELEQDEFDLDKELEHDLKLDQNVYDNLALSNILNINNIESQEVNQSVETQDNQSLETQDNQSVETQNNQYLETQDNQLEETQDNQLEETQNNQYLETQDNQLEETQNNQYLETQDNQLEETQNNQYLETQNNQYLETQNNQLEDTQDNQLDEPQNNQLDEPQNNQVAEVSDNQVAEVSDNQVGEYSDNDEELSDYSSDLEQFIDTIDTIDEDVSEIDLNKMSQAFNLEKMELQKILDETRTELEQLKHKSNIKEEELNKLQEKYKMYL